MNSRATLKFVHAISCMNFTLFLRVIFHIFLTNSTHVYPAAISMYYLPPRTFAQEIQERNDKAIKDGEVAIRHPINDSLLIEETTGYLKKVVKIMQSNSANGIIRNMTHQ
ncbi:Prolyl 4-hydroxylase subunit alpha-1 [Dirofilaria immitis]|nr:Prolyl 4-hydroxylase subunit alpha-1 [Dirofilaria immitis]